MQKQMEDQFKNHDQEKAAGHDKQTVILDESLTAETDELDTAFDRRTGPEDEDDLFPIEEDLQDDGSEQDEALASDDEEKEDDAY
jgi:hypothetical protein